MINSHHPGVEDSLANRVRYSLAWYSHVCFPTYLVSMTWDFYKAVKRASTYLT
ncbi:hypothetical protein LIA77_01942 [Sarocladium implicatum]|nr:hypothetical protein LIA77_01942 [Sarocladium implicatum]